METFTDSFNSMFLINIQQQTTTHKNYPDKLLQDRIIQHLYERIDFTTIQKVSVYGGIKGNNEANKLAKEGLEAKAIAFEDKISNPYYRAYTTR